MESSENMIKLAVGVIITLIVVSLAFVALNAGKGMFNNSMDDLEEYSATLDESKFVNYEGRTISGSQVMSLIPQWDNEVICVEVDNGSGVTQYIYKEANGTIGGESTNKVADAKDKTNAGQYINPNWKFECSIERDSFDAIYKVVFKRK